MMLKRILFPSLIIFTVLLFWFIVMPPDAAPAYGQGEPEAFAGMTWANVWYRTDLGSYDRYSPTAYVPVALIDGYILAPLYGIEFPSETFRFASRFNLYYIFMIGMVSGLTYLLARHLSLEPLPAMIMALYLGLHKGWYWGFRVMSIIAVIPLLIIYGIAILFFWTAYLRTSRKVFVTGYIVSFFLIAGAWEQWINYLFFFVGFNLLLLYAPNLQLAVTGISNASQDKTPSRWLISALGIAFPLVLFFIYMGFRASTLLDYQLSASTGEDAMIFSYLRSLGASPGTLKLMLEDVFVNATLHIASTIESLVFPWKLLSQAVVYQYDIDLFNPAHASYSNAYHYLSLTDWYAAFLSGCFFFATLWILGHLKVNRKGRDLLLAGSGLLLIYTGFLVHLPIVYRAYFAVPPYAGLLDYKHMFSVLGFSLLLGWGWEKLLTKVTKVKTGWIMTIVLVVWLIFTNFQKIY